MAKKIKVVFEMNPEDAKQLLDSGAKRGGKMSESQFKALAEKGEIHASDFLDVRQQVMMAGAVSKIGQKAVSKASSKQVQNMAVLEIVDKATSMVSDKPEEKPKPVPKPGEKPDKKEDPKPGPKPISPKPVR